MSPSPFVYKDTVWTLISGAYVAHGGEEYLTIGNFLPDDSVDYHFYSTDPVENAAHTRSALYFIDDVSITEITNQNSRRDTTICTPANFSALLRGPTDGRFFTWSTGDTTQHITVTDTGTYWCRSNTGCGEFADTIHVHHSAALPLIAPADTFICPGLPATLQAESGFSAYSWSNGSTGQTITVSSPGIYTVSAMGACGRVSDTIVVAARSASPPPVVPDTAICQGIDSPVLTVLNGSSMLWYVPGSSGAGAEQQPEVNTSEAGRQQWYVTQNTNGCESRKLPVTILINPAPVLNLNADTVFCKSFIGTIGPAQRSETYAYEWNTGDTTLLITPEAEGTYALTATNNCGIASASTTVSFSDCDNCLYLPTAFSPNSDGRNDVFTAGVRCPVRLFSLRIFNRWGQQVFQTDNIAQGWNGVNAQKGIPAEAGVYFYRLQYIPAYNLPEVVLKGDITLIR